MDIRTRVTIIQPCCGLSFFFSSTQHTPTPPSGLFANGTTLLGEMYASCAEPPPIDLCCWFAFSFSRLSWMDLLFFFFLLGRSAPTNTPPVLMPVPFCLYPSRQQAFNKNNLILEERNKYFNPQLAGKTYTNAYFTDLNTYDDY